MINEDDDKFWNLIIQRIEEEKCILILGPDVALEDEKSINDQLKEYMENTGSGKFKYYSEDEFFSFADDTDKEYAYSDVQDFHNNLKASEIHYQIADIPFHLIISISPNLLLQKVFDEKHIDYIDDFYNKEENPQPIGAITKQKPLIYNLFGNVESEGSLILTYDDLFDYLFAIFGKFELHEDLRKELQKARMILFIGFRYEKWYFKLICRILNLHKGKLSHAPLKDKKLLPDVRNFYSDELKVNFIDFNSVDIIKMLHQKFDEKNLLRTKKPQKLSDDSKIYLSYAWGGESEKIADTIYKKLIEGNYNVVRDKVDLPYKGNIKEFMQKIGKGKYVVTVISDKYLKSEKCMYEMLEIKKIGDAYNRIFPVVLTDAKISDEIDRIDYLNYWDDKVKALKEKVETLRDPVGKVRVYEKINQYADISRIIDEITDMLRDMNTLTPEMHKDRNFQPLVDAINSQFEIDKE